MNWYSKGRETIEREAEAQKAARENMPPKRVWLKENSEKHLLYLDDTGINFHEHAIDVPGNKVPTFLTCAGRDRCPCCQLGIRNHLITLYTVVDLTGYTKNNGEAVKNEKCVHALKSESALSLTRKAERWGGLRGMRVIVSRKGRKDANAGSDFEPAMKDGQMVRYSKLDWSDPKYAAFDYERFYAPKSREEILSILQFAQVDISRLRGDNRSRPSYDSSSGGGIDLPDPDFDSKPTPSQSTASPIPADADVPF